MKKQIYILILIGLVIIIGSVGAYYFFTKKDAFRADNNIPGREPGEAAVAQPLNVNNISDCDKLAGQTDKNICRQSYIIKEAAVSGDLNKCQQAGGTELTADCSAQASFSLAIKQRDKKYCGYIINKTDKENCLKVLTGMGVK